MDICRRIFSKTNIRPTFKEKFFSYAPWKHHALIVQKSKTIEEALFYIKRTVEEGLSRNALDNSIRADMYHSMGAAVTNFQERLPCSVSGHTECITLIEKRKI